ncbi:nucleotide binding protein, putative [Trichomonas vaginalis G3]|uniref:Nucleotide binding protein, putative n=1 Tax=Trichomonas vaginalis (strain ATCC PRA-98 / G3) TaxID=412133 RepID=A2E9M1_TRIV3|nr:NUBPL iron-transfer P-loop NTPase (ParA) family [Trichomonas vaginalis G3]EAY10672.1 nucleotide binding protein, putative [Trichomonas vaginalis G3]KAI5512186.1 NUBPL iron-transfer P-loop NTPase (ParA) family [Trichomonas vaginalis G3]|eukprot:XP_001322895.1 nucleotide binding protein [Trichomonas vaginalis G3]
MSCSGNCGSCSHAGTCSSHGTPEALQGALEECKTVLENVTHKILILSGKGGVGKSTLTYILTKYLAKTKKVGVLDLDLCGPSIPILFNCDVEPLLDTTFGFQPYHAAKNINVVSIQFFLPDFDSPLVARGPKKNALVLQLINQIDWSDQDFLLVDTPPGTSDEHLSVVSFMRDSEIDGAVIVTTPDEVSISDVRREIEFCQKAGVKILGVVENMSQYKCPMCGKTSSIYGHEFGGAEELCKQENLDLLGRIPIDPYIVAGQFEPQKDLPEAINDAASVICEKIQQKLSA